MEYQWCVAQRLSTCRPIGLRGSVGLQQREARLVLVFLTGLLMYICYGPNVSSGLYKYLATAVITLCMNLALQLVIKGLDNLSKYEYNYIMPLVPQWNSDVKVYQCNDYLRNDEGGEGIDENYLASKLTFGISIEDRHGNKQGKDDEIRIKWDNIRLKESPYCYVRREIRGHKESPVSFYHVYEDKEKIDQNKLLFCKIPFYVRNGYITFCLNIRFDKRKRYYHFTQLLPANDIPSLVFKDKLKPEEVKSFSRYFGISEKKLSLIKKTYINELFQDKYVPMDLMKYQGNYYWSLYELNPKFPNAGDDCVYHINARTNIYDQYIKNLDKDTSLWFYCKVDDAIQVLASFMSHPENRKRISTVDIYMLQLALIRKDKGCGKLLAIKEKPKWSILSNNYKKKYVLFESKMQRLLGI